MSVCSFPFLQVPTREEVLVVAAPPDREWLCDVFSEAQCLLRSADSVNVAASMLKEAPSPVVICAESLSDGSWRDVLARVQDLPHPSLVIVLAVANSSGLYAEVLEEGGFEVLYRPFEPSRILHSIQIATRRWTSELIRQEMRQQAPAEDEWGDSRQYS
jgi:DNA-binding NtrC family response regulator